MKKTAPIALVILLVLLLIVLFTVAIREPNDKSEIYRNMINSDFNIELNENNSSLEFVNSLLSRDSIYVICFKLSNEYSLRMKGQDIFNREGKSTILNQYVEPYIHVIDGIEAMLTDGNSSQSYIALNIRDYSEYSQSFSVLLLNTKKNTLYWFFYST